jgi:hypothetical protein
MSDRSPHDPAYAPETEQFDREINVRGVVWSGVVLVVVAVVAHLVVWWMLKGFQRYDEKRDVRLSPIEAASPQPPPPAPLLQQSPVLDMSAMRENEDRELNQAAWIDQRQGLVRLPLRDAIDIVAARGVAPEVVGGRTGAPVTTDAAGNSATTPGATVQNARPVLPAGPAGAKGPKGQQGRQGGVH